MKNMFKRVLLVTLAVIMVVSCAGCGKKKGNANFEVDLNSPVLISKEPIELTYFFRASNDEDGQYGMFKEAAKMTGIFAKTTVSKSNSNLTQSFNLMLASGDIDDLVFTQDELQFVKYGMEGAFVPLDEHLDIMPNFKKLIENSEIKRNITAIDGHIYYVPFMQAGKTTGGWFVRQDWMEKLGLKNPTNAEEMYNVLKAFKTQDPNGNGIADEVPYFGTASNMMKELFPLWNARQGWYAKNGKIGFGPLNPEYKTAMTNIIKWYNEGLLDKEIITSTTSPRERMLMDNIGGMTNDWFASTARFNDTIKDIPGFKFTPFAPPANIVLESRPVSSNYGWGIYSGTEYLEEACKFLDFWLSEEGSRLINFGVEGKHHTMVDGKPQFTEEVLSQDNPQTYLRQFGCWMGIGYKQDFQSEEQWMNQIAVDGMKMYEDGNWFAEQIPQTLHMQMTEAEREEYMTLKTAIETHYDEKFQKWILGSANFEADYDKFISDVKNLGLDRLIELMNIAYSRYLSIK